MSEPSAPTTEPESAVAADMLDPRLVSSKGARGSFDAFRNRVRSGDLGSLPVVLGLIVIVITFQSLNSAFLSAFNLVNLTLQIAAIGTISVGVILVLLLGEIDLSIGSVSGLCAAITVVLNVNRGWNPWLAVVAGVLAGGLVGLFQGSVFAKIGVPSFVVTLAGLLTWQGLQLKVLGADGTINLPTDGPLIALGQTDFLPAAVSYVLAIACAALFLFTRLNENRLRARAGLSTGSWIDPFVKSVLIAAALCVVCWRLNEDRGVSVMLIIFVAIVVVLDYYLRRTRPGRSVYATGGSAEAARRSGISVDRVRILVFMGCSMLAAFGGILAACRLGSVSQSSGSGDVLVNAIAAAVIGGTSLFGGRGRTYSALLGILVIGSINNGLTLLSLSSDVRFMITGGVLLLAVVIDALASRGRAAAGRG